MQTLLERLKPEFKKSIDEKAEKYPFSHKSIIDAFSKNKFWNDLTIEQMNRFISQVDVSTMEMSMYDVLYGERFLNNHKND